MSEKKIPDKSNFLEKFAAIESFLQKKVGSESYSDNKEIEESTNSQHTGYEKQIIEQGKKCNICGADRNPEDVFCGTCGNKLQDN